jgi:ABC-type transporter MlaC component
MPVMRESRILACTSVALVVMLCPATGVRAAQETEADRANEAREALAAAVAKLSSIFQDVDETPDARRARVEVLLVRSLDMPFITSAALGRNADTLSRDQAIEFAQEMERYVVANWLQRIARSQVDDFEIMGASWNAATGVAVVQTRGGRRIVTNPRSMRRSGTGEARVDYQMSLRRGVWRIRTIVIDGVDVVSLFREQFDSVLRRKDPDEMIDRVRAINDRLESTNPLADS